jgi:hypothetical protein
MPLKVYTNPTGGDLTVEITDAVAGDFVCIVHDLLGHEVYSKYYEFTEAGLHRILFPLGSLELAAGVYSLRYLTADRVEEARVVVE